MMDDNPISHAIITFYDMEGNEVLAQSFNAIPNRTELLVSKCNFVDEQRYTVGKRAIEAFQDAQAIRAKGT